MSSSRSLPSRVLPPPGFSIDAPMPCSPNAGIISVPNRINSLFKTLLLHSQALCSRTSQTLVPEMAPPTNSRRPICPLCFKPPRTCLCNRLPVWGLDNKVGVTILQHSLERKHPLNSTRIAILGLNNLNVVTVSDVNIEAQFDIRLLDQGLGFGGTLNANGLGSEEKRRQFVDSSVGCSLGCDQKGAWDGGNPQRNKEFLQNTNLSSSNEASVAETDHEFTVKDVDLGAKRRVDTDVGRNDKAEVCHEKELLKLDHDPTEMAASKEECVITATIGKRGIINSLTHVWISQAHLQELNFDHTLASEVAVEALAKGFSVKRLQKRLMGKREEEYEEYEEYVEFDIAIPPGSILLFPSEKSVGVDEIDFEVKNLIVLDGTWSKAKRMYFENPWLKLLPHVKLEVEKMSLYGEVRHQPRPGYLSTIESIVYSLKAVGDNPEGLEGLLDVFESMVGDQRQCKDERLSKASLL